MTKRLHENKINFICASSPVFSPPDYKATARWFLRVQFDGREIMVPLNDLDEHAESLNRQLSEILKPRT